MKRTAAVSSIVGRIRRARDSARARPTAAEAVPGSLTFRCNLCGSTPTIAASTLGRESGFCPSCQSSVRLRGLARALTLRLLGRPAVLSDLPANLTGVGLSDHPSFARALERRLQYVNTSYHQPPVLDITHPGADYLGRADFLVSSDVFEHVNPPVLDAFTGTLRVLKPGGVLALTVPFVGPASLPATLEHYPDLFDWTIETVARGGRQVRNTRRDGTVEIHENPVFHGGDGQTLEMRVFQETDLLQNLTDAGFVDIQVHDEHDLEWGVLWNPHRTSVPITARRPA